MDKSKDILLEFNKKHFEGSKLQVANALVEMASRITKTKEGKLVMDLTGIKPMCISIEIEKLK